MHWTSENTYWSSTTDVFSPVLAWIVYLPAGGAGHHHLPFLPTFYRAQRTVL
jgi:hypothetical protein